jgi:GNAT superfamily N-acetyltransferase
MVAIIRALPDQALALQAIARASKQHWGYDTAYMQAWTHDKTLTADFVARHVVFYAADGLKIAGFYALEWEASGCELKHLWVSPDYIGQGIGRDLFRHLLSQLETLGAETCKIVAEPHAEGFYRHMGAVWVGDRAMPQLGQVLPVLQLTLYEKA